MASPSRAGVAVPTPSFTVITFLARDLEYPDQNLAQCVIKGMPIAGAAPPTPGLTPRETPTETSYAKWKAETPTRNKTIIERAAKAHGSEISNACWEKSRAGIQDGWLSKPAPLDAVTAGAVALTPRYAHKEEHGGRESKIRVIDDFKASGINALLETTDTNIPDTIDAFLTAATYYKIIDKNAQLQAASTDYRRAYKNLPIGRDQAEFASILLAPPPGPLMVAKLQALPFGSHRAPRIGQESPGLLNSHSTSCFQ